jgi:two-component system sensor histidine kinase ChvG
MIQKKPASILRKFLLFNFFVFLVLGLFTFLYLKAIQPNLVKNKVTDQLLIIKNTSDHLERLNIKFKTEEIKTFLLSARFLFQSLDRVQFYNLQGDLVGDTDILDLDQDIFNQSGLIIDQIQDDSIQKLNTNIKVNKKENSKDNNQKIKKIILNDLEKESLVIESIIKNNFFVQTLSEVIIDSKKSGYILVSEEANEIFLAVQERKNFIIRTVLAIALVIFIFSVFLNKYILKPIGLLVKYTESIKAKSDQPVNIENFFTRSDEIGKLTKSINEMTIELQKRTNRAESFSMDLAHEIRNPLASLKGASELIDKASEKNREKLFKIINHDVERIDRLITDYSQMLKDEASLVREKMIKIDLNLIITNVVEDFKQTLISQNKNISITISNKIKENGIYILGIENRIEQVVANLLDNSISFSKDKDQIVIEIIEKNRKEYSIFIKDQGPGFKEKNVQNIFKRFYSNRPSNFGEHSGLGLNIVKNIIELHNGKIMAANRFDKKGAQIEVRLPKLN